MMANLSVSGVLLDVGWECSFFVGWEIVHQKCSFKNHVEGSRFPSFSQYVSIWLFSMFTHGLLA